MLMASGANYGFKRTIPHMLGVGFGFSLMLFIVGVGIVKLFELWPLAFTILKVLSVIYMLWLAWKIANASAPDSKVTTQKPMTFLQAMLFQWVNPKAWSMGMTAVTIYAPQKDIHSVLYLSLVFGLVNLPSVSSWAVLGLNMRRWLMDPKHLRAFNWGMAALLVGSLAMMI